MHKTYKYKKLKKYGKGVKLTSTVKEARKEAKKKVKLFNQTKRKLKTLNSKFDRSLTKIKSLENKLASEQNKSIELQEKINEENDYLDYYKRELTYSDLAK